MYISRKLSRETKGANRSGERGEEEGTEVSPFGAYGQQLSANPLELLREAGLSLSFYLFFFGY